jgi:membrane-associated protease RseP (regulator of RpoE activity)
MPSTPVIPIIPLVVFAISLSLLGWGFYRARKLGKLAILSRMQLVALLLPWIAYFGLLLSGAFISFTLLLVLLVISSVAYILIGSQMRKIALDDKNNPPPKHRDNSPSAPTPDMPESPVTPSQTAKEAAKPQITETKEIKENKFKVGEDLKLIQGIFGIETFYATETLPYMEGIIFRGNMRGEPLEVHQRLSATLRDRLGDKYDLFLVEGQEDKPVVIVLPHNPGQFVMTVPQKILIAILFVANIFTAMSLGAELQKIDLSQHPERYLATIPFALGIILILGCREAALRWMSRKYDVRLSWPSCLPSLQLGSFGAFSRVLSNLPNRQVLFDLGIAPAVAGGLLSLVILVTGLFLSANHNGGVEIPTQLLHASVLVGGLAKLIMGDLLRIELVDINPLVILGWLGLVITALNLMPAGQLDGGRIVQAVYGRKTAGWTTIATLIFLAIAALINSLALYWGGIILVLLRDLERPLLNEVSELDSDRDALGIFALFWMLITLLPMTSAVAEQLGIGG